MTGTKNADEMANVAGEVDTAVAKADEDLDSIMQELESLDQEVGAAMGATEPTSSATSSTTPPASSSGEAVTALRPNRKARTNAVGGAPSTQALTLELTGSLNLKLAFATGNRQVELVCSEDALVCRFGDGTEVRIPTDSAKGVSTKRAA